MSCNHPYKAFWTGGYTESGKKDYILTMSTSGNLLSTAVASRKGKRITGSAPVVRLNGHTFLKDPVAIPCGKCVGCRMDRASEWKNRCVLESARFPLRTWFVTLTYDEAHLPITGDGEPYLRKSDLQRFMRRLRYQTDRPFRFLACGEYGEHGHRPHYHLILFGELAGFERTGINRFQCQDINKAWEFGLTETSLAEPATMAYVCGYVEKKQKDQDWDTYPVKPFLLMSRKPAIGDWYREEKDLAKLDFKIYGDFGSSKFASLPRIFVRKSENEIWYANYKARMEAAAKESLARDRFHHGLQDEEDIGFHKDLLDNMKLDKKEKVL